MQIKVYCFAIQFCESQEREHIRLADQCEARGEDAGASVHLETANAWAREAETIKAMMRQETGTTFEQAMSE